MKEKKTLLVAFSTQKGGIGKSTLTVLMASYFHYVKGYHVGVVDCDFAQFSICNMRERDRQIVTTTDHYKLMAYNQLKRTGKKIYPIVKSKASEAINTAEKMIKDSPEGLDIIFFDLPGTLNSEGILHTISTLDYIIAPISADRMVLQSTLEYAALINEKIITTGKGNIEGLYLLWNMVDARERTNLYHAYDTIIAELGLQVMKNVLPETKRYRHELTEEVKPVFRSTIFPPDKRLMRGTNLDLIADEIEQITKLKPYGREEQ